LLTALVALFAMAQDAQAGQRGEQRARGRIVAGPIIGGIAANNGYYAYGPYYWPGSALGWSALYGPTMSVAPGCYRQRQRIWTEYGWRWREAPICY
jgi:hypothetical protein